LLFAAVDRDFPATANALLKAGIDKSLTSAIGNRQEILAYAIQENASFIMVSALLDGGAYWHSPIELPSTTTGLDTRAFNSSPLLMVIAKKRKDIMIELFNRNIPVKNEFHLALSFARGHQKDGLKNKKMASLLGAYIAKEKIWDAVHKGEEAFQAFLFDEFQSANSPPVEDWADLSAVLEQEKEKIDSRFKKVKEDKAMCLDAIEKGPKALIDLLRSRGEAANTKNHENWLTMWYAVDEIKDTNANRDNDNDDQPKKRLKQR